MDILWGAAWLTGCILEFHVGGKLDFVCYTSVSVDQHDDDDDDDGRWNREI